MLDDGNVLRRHLAGHVGDAELTGAGCLIEIFKSQRDGRTGGGDEPALHAGDFGTVGQLARTNAIRNPRRTAATAFALTLGLVLVAGIAVIGSSVKTSLNKIVDTTVTADFIVTTNGELGVPQPAADAATKVQGVGSSTTFEAGFFGELDRRLPAGP